MCPGTRLVAYIAGEAPPDTAKCYPNEVSVPLVIGKSVSSASRTLAGVPLEPEIILIPAKPGKHPGEVMNQEPRGGFLSGGDGVKLYVSHAQHGLVPNLVGSSLTETETQLTKLRLKAKIEFASGQTGTVLRQSLPPGVAVAPGMKITLVVGRG